MSKQEQEVKRLLTALRREGEEGLSVPNSIRLQAIEAQKPLSPFPGKTIVDAARFLAQHLESLQRSVSVRQLVDEYLKGRSRATGAQRSTCAICRGVTNPSVRTLAITRPAH